MLRKITTIIILIYSAAIFVAGLFAFWVVFFNSDSFIKHLFAEIVTIDIWLLNLYVLIFISVCSGASGIVAAILIWKSIRGSERFWLVLILFQLIVSFFQVGSYVIGKPDLFTIATVGCVFLLSMFAFSRDGILYLRINSQRYILELLLLIIISSQVAGITLINIKIDNSVAKEIDVDQVLSEAFQNSFIEDVYGSEAEKYMEFIDAYENKDSHNLIKYGEYLIKNGYENDRGILSHMAVDYYAQGKKYKAAELLEDSIRGNYISELAGPSDNWIHLEEGQLHYMLYMIYSEVQILEKAKKELEIALDSFRRFIGDDYSDSKLNNLIKASQSRLNHFVEFDSDTDKNNIK